MTATAMHGVRLNVANLDRAQQFYTGLGMVEDIGMRRADRPDGLTTILAANDPGHSGARSVSLRWPNDPYMHVNLVASDAESPQKAWPKSVDQLGSTVLTLLVADLDAEVHRLVDDGASICVDAAATARLSGSTRSSYVVDPEGNVVELLECSPGRGWGFAACTVVGAQATFLHLQLNTYHYEADVRVLCRFRIRPGSAERRKAERRLPRAHRHEQAQSLYRSLRSATQQQGHQQRQLASTGGGPLTDASRDHGLERWESGDSRLGAHLSPAWHHAVLLQDHRTPGPAR